MCLKIRRVRRNSQAESLYRFSRIPGSELIEPSLRQRFSLGFTGIGHDCL